MLSCVSGMVDHLYKYRGSNTYINGDSVERIKDRHSVVVVSKEWVVGFPKDIQFKNRFGELCNLHLISMVTEVDPSWLAEIAPQLVSVEEGVAPVYDHEKDSCVSTKIVSFNSQEISREQQETPEHDQAASCFADWLARQFG